MTPADFCATPPNPGIVRKHGSNGAFVSRWIIDQQTLKVLKGEDFTRSTDKVHLWDPLNGEYEPIGRTTQWRRLCSADLPRGSAFFDSISGLGTPIEFSSTVKKSPKPILRAHGRALSQDRMPERPGNCHGSAGCHTKTSWPAPIPRKKPWCFLPTMVT
jgi:hypothetical protein